MLNAQTITVPGEPRLGAIVAELASELDRLDERRDRLAVEIEAVFRSHPLGPILILLPGMGPRLGSKIVVEVGDGTRFASGAQLASYAGLAPVTRQSGTSIRGEKRSRRGPRRLAGSLRRGSCASRLGWRGSPLPPAPDEAGLAGRGSSVAQALAPEDLLGILLDPCLAGLGLLGI